MTVKVVTDFGELLRLARAQAAAERIGDPELIEKARREHEAYRDLCLKSDQMSTGFHVGDLS